MVSARIPDNENTRLQALYDSHLLDTPGEREFDEIVKFASELCSMPISLISLVDSNRQWFKARVGLDVSETNRDVSFCSHAILEDHLFEVPDTTKDSRFSDNPLVTDAPDIRFYAGMPLVTSSGSRLGTLCVIDRMPRNLTDEQRFGLKVLANNVIKVAELRIKNRELVYLTENQKKIISILAHDVRNPLASIKNIIDFKQSEILDADEANQMMKLVAAQLTTTIKMVENVVDWGRLQLQFGHLQFKDFDLHALVERVFGLESLKSLNKNNTLINHTVKGTIIHSDEQALEFILRNLISNSNKFTQNGSITVNSQKGAKTTIWVVDTGVGMNEEQAAKLFSSEAYKSTPGTNQEKGSGLGLMLVKEFIDRMDGTIKIETGVNKGTSFKVVI